MFLLQRLIELAREHPMTAEELHEQMVSFAFGNAHMADDRVTRPMIESACLELARRGAGGLCGFSDGLSPIDWRPHV